MYIMNLFIVDPYRIKGRKGTFHPAYDHGSQTVIDTENDRYYEETRPKVPTQNLIHNMLLLLCDIKLFKMKK